MSKIRHKSCRMTFLKKTKKNYFAVKIEMKLPKILVSGFNGFGQFKNLPNEIITSFTGMCL